MSSADREYLDLAVEAAKRGAAAGNHPYGAVIVRDGEVVAEAHNRVRSDADPTAHAETEAIRAAARRLGSSTLEGCTLYTTCEPCAMCAAAIGWAGIDRVVYGAKDPDVGGTHLPIETKSTPAFEALETPEAIRITEQAKRGWMNR